MITMISIILILIIINTIYLFLLALNTQKMTWNKYRPLNGWKPTFEFIGGGRVVAVFADFLHV